MSNIKIAVLIHLFYTDMWDEMCVYLDNLGDHDYDLHINLVDGFYSSGDIEKIKKYRKNVNIITSPNNGVDVGGFLRQYRTITVDYDLILKIHTKKSIGTPEKPSDMVRVYGRDDAVKRGTEWFDRLMGGVLKSKNQVKDIIELLSEDGPFGMSGLDTESYAGPNIQYIKTVANTISIPVEFNGSQIKNSKFVGGTIFWVKNDIMKKYLTEDNINKLLEMLPDGYNNEPSYSHALERLFGLMVYNEKKKIIIL